VFYVDDQCRLSAFNCLERLVSEVTCYLSCGTVTLNAAVCDRFGEFCASLSSNDNRCALLYVNEMSA